MTTDALDAPRSAGLLPAGVDPVAWLVDRALISDLLIEFARALDDQDWATYVGLYLPDGTFGVGGHVIFRGHDELALVGSPFGLGQYEGTWHGSSNHAITIGVDGDGDTARTRSYLNGVHRLDDDLSHHADGGGWYDCTLRRTTDGWRFASVEVTERWRNDVPMPHMDGPPPGP